MTDTLRVAASLISPHSISQKVAVCGPACRANPITVARQPLSSQISHFFSHLFDTSDWPARWHCGTWSDFHGWLYIASDLLIFASYYAIPVLLARMLTRRHDIPFPKIIWLFGAFIILCGTTHLLDAFIFWWPAYRLSALVRFFTGVVSMITLYALYKIMPMVLSLRSVDELQHEIEQRKIAEEKLAASEFLLKEAGRIGRVGGWEYDVLSKKVTCSSTIYDIFEIASDYDVDNPGRFSFFLQQSRQQLTGAISRAYNQGSPWDLELQITTGKGAEIWIRSCGEAFYDNHGNISKLRGVFMDIDKYKNNEHALNKSHEMLFESHQQLKTFTHILSHNIRNHASNILLLTDLVDTHTLDNNGELFTKITKVAHGLNSTLNDLSQAILIRESVVAAEQLSFRNITDKLFEIMESEISNSSARIRCDFKVKTILFPKLYLESILMNLMSNAIKYKKEGEAADIKIRTYLDKNGRIVLECEDNGIGIDLRLHGSKIFGLYKTFHTHKEAHGVGLFLVKTQVESQGGMISVHSQLGKGSVFKITF